MVNYLQISSVLTNTLSITLQGYFYGNLGPALPDIQLLTGKSLDVVSWLFTATYAGSMIGTLICGPVCDRVGPQLVLFVSVFMASLLTGVLFYSPNFTIMVALRVVTGIFIGGVDLGKTGMNVVDLKLLEYLSFFFFQRILYTQKC